MKFDEVMAEQGVNFGRAPFRLWSFFLRWRPWNRPARKLQLRETVSLGSRGLLAVVQYREQQFLLGCTNSSIAMLAQLTDAPKSDGVARLDSRGEE